MIEIEVQNETHQSQERLRFATVPRIGEGLRLKEPDGCWASYDILDVWYQKAEYGDVWVPYLHVCMTPEEKPSAEGRMPESFDVLGSADETDLPPIGSLMAQAQDRTEEEELSR